MSFSVAYTTLAVQLQQGSNVTKALYLKPHTPKDGSEHAVARALFVAGLPLQLTEARLLTLFQVFGSVEQVRSSAEGLLLARRAGGCDIPLDRASCAAQQMHR